MEKYIKPFDDLITMIKMAMTEEGYNGIAVREYAGKFVYGKMNSGFIEKPFELNVTDRDNICQQLYDCLIVEFGEQLIPGYSHSFDGKYEYFMTMGDNVMILFPTGFEYSDWIYNQIQKDNEKARQKNSVSMNSSKKTVIDSIDQADVVASNCNHTLMYKQNRDNIPPTLTAIIEGKKYTKYNPEYIEYLKEKFPPMSDREIEIYIDQKILDDEENKKKIKKL